MEPPHRLPAARLGEGYKESQICLPYPWPKMNVARRRPRGARGDPELWPASELAGNDFAQALGQLHVLRIVDRDDDDRRPLPVGERPPEGRPQLGGLVDSLGVSTEG